VRSTVNLGPESRFIISAKDDALDVFTVRLQDLADGKTAMAFRHVAFLENACAILEKITGEPKYRLMKTQFAFLDKCSISRNKRLSQLYNGVDMYAVMQAVRARMEGAEADVSGSVAFVNYVVELRLMVDMARTLGVDISKYVDVSSDHVEVAGFKNPWCRDVQDIAVETGDLVSIIIDADNIPHLLVIVRKFSPGINQVSLPGGFKEASETWRQTCIREYSEETSFESTGMRTAYYDLDTITSSTFDPRPRVSKHGSISNALLCVSTVERLH